VDEGRVGHVEDEGPGPAAVASSNGDVVDEPSGLVWLPGELTSFDVTATATELITDTTLYSDVERGK